MIAQYISDLDGTFIMIGYDTLFQWILRGIVGIVVLQAITILLVRYSHKRRHARTPEGGYPTTPLAPIQIEDACIQIYMEGISLFADMATAIEQAQHTIYFETFIWKNDVLGKKFMDLLVQKAKEGVEVYLIYDWLGNGVLGTSRLQFPDNIPTLHVLSYLSFQRASHFFNPDRYNVTHRKILVVDNDLGFVGGYNLGEEYRTEWRDTHIRIHGKGAEGLTHAFVDFWNHHCRADQPKLPWPKQPWSAHIDVYRNDPLRRNYPIRSLYLRAIERAQSYILITNAYFVPDPTFRHALIEAAQRGVSVKIVLPWRSNHVLVDWISRHYFRDYLESGVELYGYEGAMIHTKTVTVDGTWTMIGTANLDRLSLWFNHEVNIEIFDKQVAAQMEAIFTCDREQCREVDLAIWDDRSVFMRLGELILSPLWPFV
ncbi:MAG: phospholipase D-like domain-containing protein [Chloroflexota bacterium]